MKSSSRHDDQVCSVCGDWENANVMLLCDACDSGFHTFCVGLNAVPDSPRWYCPFCVTAGYGGPLGYQVSTPGVVYDVRTDRKPVDFAEKKRGKFQKTGKKSTSSARTGISGGVLDRLGGVQHDSVVQSHTAGLVYFVKPLHVDSSLVLIRPNIKELELRTNSVNFVQGIANRLCMDEITVSRVIPAESLENVLWECGNRVGCLENPKWSRESKGFCGMLNYLSGLHDESVVCHVTLERDGENGMLAMRATNVLQDKFGEAGEGDMDVVPIQIVVSLVRGLVSSTEYKRIRVASVDNSEDDDDDEEMLRTDLAATSLHKPKKHRARRCGQCEGCQIKQICGTCVACLHKPQFGGTGSVRRGCHTRTCVAFVRPDSLDGAAAAAAAAGIIMATPQKPQKRTQTISPEGALKKPNLNTDVCNVQLDLFAPRRFMKQMATIEEKAMLQQLIETLETRLREQIATLNLTCLNFPFRVSRRGCMFDFEPTGVVVETKEGKHVDWCIPESECTVEMMNYMTLHPRNNSLCFLGISTYLDVLDSQTLHQMEEESFSVYSKKSQKQCMRSDLFGKKNQNRALAASTTKINVFYGAKTLLAEDDIRETSITTTTRCELTMLSLRVFSDSNLSFKKKSKTGKSASMNDGEFQIPMPRGSAMMVQPKSYASDFVEPFIRPFVFGKSGMLLFRQMHDELLLEALEIEDAVDGVDRIDLGVRPSMNVCKRICNVMRECRQVTTTTTTTRPVVHGEHVV